MALWLVRSATGSKSGRGMMQTHFITDTDLVTFFTSLEKRGPMYMAVRDDQGTVGIKPYGEVGTYSYPGVRAFQPLKPFFFSALEEVAEERAMYVRIRQQPGDILLLNNWRMIQTDTKRRKRRHCG